MIMHSYIIIQHTQSDCEIALFANTQKISSHTQEKRSISSTLIISIEQILVNNALQLSDLAFIGINQGPGSFSTLRSIIATVNGLHLATNIPLIGVDALEATAYEYACSSKAYSAVLFNAFNHEVYYRINHNNRLCFQGYGTLKHLFTLLETVSPEEIYCIGDGALLYKNELLSHESSNVIIPETVPLLCSIEMLSKLAYEKYNNNEYGSCLFPLHLKKHQVEK